MSPRLTVVIPLRGRRLFTFRCLWHANEAQIPYRFLIADGLVHEEVARRLEDSRSVFPHLDIEYLRYPDDTSYSRYWEKMADAHTRVRTPYFMDIDNDDFVGFAGTEHALDFLDANPDFACARGRTAEFFVCSPGGGPGGVHGKLNRLRADHNYIDVTAATAAERLRQGGLCHALSSSVFRTEPATALWRESAEIDFSDLMLQESFFALRALTLGKVHMSKKTVNKYGQALTGISYQPKLDWASHLLNSRFTTDAQAMIAHIASGAAGDGSSSAAVAENVREMLETYFEGYLSTIYGASAVIKNAMRMKLPRLVHAVQTRPRMAVGRERVGLFSLLRQSGAGAEDIRHVREELSAVERALSEDAFAEYAGTLLALAKSTGGQEWLHV
jgi:glycosyltransferase domain-containing protein